MDDTVELSQFGRSVLEKQPGSLTDIYKEADTPESSTTLGCFSIQESGQNGENNFLLMHRSIENYHVMTSIHNRVNAAFIPNNFDHVSIAVEIRKLKPSLRKWKQHWHILGLRFKAAPMRS